MNAQAKTHQQADKARGCPENPDKENHSGVSELKITYVANTPMPQE